MEEIIKYIAATALGGILGYFSRIFIENRLALSRAKEDRRLTHTIVQLKLSQIQLFPPSIRLTGSNTSLTLLSLISLLIERLCFVSFNISKAKHSVTLKKIGKSMRIGIKMFVAVEQRVYFSPMKEKLSLARKEILILLFI